MSSKRPKGAKLFLVLSRIAVATYGRFPIFGPLRSSTAVYRRDGLYLVVRRADELGLGFPGGLAWPWENDEQALRREVQEETGLEVVAARLLFRYKDQSYIPGLITVFEIDARGVTRGSWEGSPLFLTLEEINRDVFASHAEIARYLQQNHA